MRNGLSRVMCILVAAWAATTMVSAGTPVLRNPVVEQLGACTGTGAVSQIFPDLDDARIQSADDFSLTDDTTVGQIVALGSFDAAGGYESVTVEFFLPDGPGGLPGTLLCRESELQGAGGPVDPLLDLSLAGECTLPAGSYWVSVLVVMPLDNGDTGLWLWSTNDSSNGSEFAFREPDSQILPPCEDWGLARTDCGLSTTHTDLCLGIGRADDGANTPATGPFGIVALLVTVLALSGHLLRRGGSTRPNRPESTRSRA